jgi:ribosomal protein S18 acetylase RimI-like enzyme
MGDSAGDPPDPRLGGRWPTRATSATMERRAKTAAAPIVGVVELSIQRDAEVTEKLPAPGEGRRGVPGAATPWADGAGAGGALEVWAEKRAASRSMRARPGRWRGGAPADEYAYVSCMCVKDEFRRRGVADALLRAAEKVALDWGYDCAALHVFRRNEPAIALYRGRGYEVVDDSCSPVDAMLGKQRYLMVKKLR